MDFDNFANYSGDMVNDSYLSKLNISYCRFRLPADALYEYRGEANTVTLAEAEALLARGYVFGGHSCPLCMREQTPVSFEGYEYVSVVYIQGNGTYESDDPQLILPFYAFYKYLGTSANGSESMPAPMFPP